MYSFNPCKINFARLPIVSGTFVCIIFTKLNTFGSLLISGENRYLALRLFNFVHSYKKWISSPMTDLSQFVQCLSALGTLKCLLLLTGNLCVPILNWNNAFLKCSGRISVYFSFPCGYLKVLYIILLLSIASHVILMCQSYLNWSHSHLCTLLLSTLKSCVAQI